MMSSALTDVTLSAGLVQRTLDGLGRLRAGLSARNSAGIRMAVADLQQLRPTVSKLEQAPLPSAIRASLRALRDELRNALDPIGPNLVLPIAAERRIRALGSGRSSNGTAHVNIGPVLRTVENALSAGEYAGITAAGPAAQRSKEILLEASSRANRAPVLDGHELLILEKRVLLQLLLDPVLRATCRTLPELGVERYAIRNDWIPPLYRRWDEMGGAGLWWNGFRAQFAGELIRAASSRELDTAWAQLGRTGADDRGPYDVEIGSVVPELWARIHLRAAFNEQAWFLIDSEPEPMVERLLSALQANLALEREAQNIQQIGFRVFWPEAPRRAILCEAFAASDTPFRLCETMLQHLSAQGVPSDEHGGILLDNLGFLGALAAVSLETLASLQQSLGVHLVGQAPLHPNQGRGFGPGVTFENGKFSLTAQPPELSSALRTGCPFLHGGSIREIAHLYVASYDRARSISSAG